MDTLKPLPDTQQNLRENNGLSNTPENPKSTTPKSDPTITTIVDEPHKKVTQLDETTLHQRIFPTPRSLNSVKENNDQENVQQNESSGTEKSVPVLCVEKSKVVEINGAEDNIFRRKMSSKQPPDQIIPPRENKMNADNNMNADDSKALRTVYPRHGIITCYACSNVSNPHCNKPNARTTVKHCYEPCIKKTVYAEGK